MTIPTKKICQYTCFCASISPWTLLAYNSAIALHTENFMTGYRVIFDREKLVLGWKKFDCKFCSHYAHTFLSCFHLLPFSPTLGSFAGYDIEDHNTFPIKPHSTTVPPAVAVGLGNYSSPKSTKEGRNSSQSSVAWPSFYSHPFPLACFRFIIMLFLLL